MNTTAALRATFEFASSVPGKVGLVGPVMEVKEEAGRER